MNTFLLRLTLLYSVIALGHSTRRGLLCGPNERYVPDKRSCPPQTCFAVLAFYDCRNATVAPGCVCMDGFMRLTETSPCIPSCHCPQLANSPECLAKSSAQFCSDPNEEYVLEKPNCPAQECSWLIKRTAGCLTAPPPIPGCACKNGYTRKAPGSPCIPVCECEEMRYAPLCFEKK